MWKCFRGSICLPNARAQISQTMALLSNSSHYYWSTQCCQPRNSSLLLSIPKFQTILIVLIIIIIKTVPRINVLPIARVVLKTTEPLRVVNKWFICAILDIIHLCHFIESPWSGYLKRCSQGKFWGRNLTSTNTDQWCPRLNREPGPLVEDVNLKNKWWGLG